MEILNELSVEREEEAKCHKFIIYFLYDDEDQNVFVEEDREINFEKVIRHLNLGGSIFITHRRRSTHTQESVYYRSYAREGIRDSSCPGEYYSGLGPDRSRIRERTERNVIKTEGSDLSIRDIGKPKVLALRCVILVLLLSFSAITLVRANVPTVLNIEATKEEADTVLGLEISHSYPSSAHYVDVIEVQINERLDRISDLEPQTTTTFTYAHNIGNVEYETVRVRAHCTDHGWSPWANIEALPEPSFIETPLGMVTIAGMVVAAVIIVFAVLKKTRS